MTREEEMWQAVEEEHGTLLPRESFITLTAMEWADKTMIDKACNWLMQYGCQYATEEVMVEHFRKAMEE